MGPPGGPPPGGPPGVGAAFGGAPPGFCTNKTEGKVLGTHGEGKHTHTDSKQEGANTLDRSVRISGVLSL